MCQIFRAFVILSLLLCSAPLATAAEKPEPALRIIGATDTDGLKFSTSAASFSRTLFVEVAGTNSPTQLSIQFPDLVGPDSQAVETKWSLDGKTGADAVTTVTASQAARLDFQAKLRLAGEYSSWITLIGGGQRVATVWLRITRTTGTPSIRVASATSVSFEGLSENPVVKFTLLETSGLLASLYVPVLAKLGRKDGDRLLQANYSGVEFLRVKPDGNVDKIPESLLIEPNASVPVVMKVVGLSQPGEYTGALVISSEDGILPDQTVTIYIKRHWSFAVAFIALGVVASYYLRRWGKVDRPRLIQQRRVLQLGRDLEDLGAKLPKPDQDVLAVLRERLEKLNDELGLGFADKPDDILKDVNGKLSLLPLWSALRIRLEAVQLPAVRSDLQPVLDEAEQFLRNTQPGDPEPIRAKLNSARSTIEQKLREDLRAKIADTLRQAKEQSEKLAPDRKAEFDLNVIATLTKADKAAEEEPMAQAQARALLDDARKSFARIRANDLEEKLGTLKKPDQINQQEWEGLINVTRSSAKDARAATDGAAATAAADSAYASYLRLLITIAQAQANVLLTRARANAATFAEQIKSLEQAQQSLNDALNRINNMELAEASQAYESARTIIEAAEKVLPAPALMDDEGKLGKPTTVKLAVANSIVTFPDISGASQETIERKHRVWRDLKAIEDKILKRDRVIALVVGLVAIGLGVYLLWVENSTWGSVKDIIAALLWGLGMHQTAGNVIGSKLDLGAIEDQLTGTKPAVS